MKKKILKIIYNATLIIILSIVSTLEQLDYSNLDYSKIPSIFFGVALGAFLKFILKPFLLELLFKKEEKKEDQDNTKLEDK